MNREERVAAAHAELTAALVALADEGEAPPCADLFRRDLWISDSADQRAEAAERCGPCPIRRQCGETARAAGEKFAVWGGVDRTPSKAVR